MQITVDLKELEVYQNMMEKWALDRAHAVAAHVPVRHDMMSGRLGRDPAELRKAFEDAKDATPMPLLIPRA